MADPVFEAIEYLATTRVQWTLGPLRLQAQARPPGLWVEARRSGDPFDPGWAREELSAEDGDGDEGPPVIFQRLFAGFTPPFMVNLRPRLADRPIITRPEMEVVLGPGVSTDVYLSSPLWIEVCVGGEALCELPTWRASDTWFGPDTTHGVLGYAGRTSLRTQRSEVYDTPSRVATLATISNRQSRPVVLDRVALPMPNMGVYRDRDGRFWSDSVRVHCLEDKEAEVTITAPKSAQGLALERVGGPREIARSDGFLEAFSAVMRGTS